MSVIRVFLVLMMSKRLYPLNNRAWIERILSILFFRTGASRFWCNFLQLLWPDGFQSESISIYLSKKLHRYLRNPCIKISNQAWNFSSSKINFLLLVPIIFRYPTVYYDPFHCFSMVKKSAQQSYGYHFSLIL